MKKIKNIFVKSKLYNKIKYQWNSIEKKKRKIIIGTFIAFSLLIVVLSLGNSYSKVEGAYLNDQTVSGLHFSNATINYNDGLTTYSVDVSNTLESDYSLKNISVVFKDKNKKEIITLVGYIGEELTVAEKQILNASVDKEIKDIDKIEYIINK